ncbi:hypothetical protein BCR34DRAFT_595601 [Clohesyomyces aquaticus]|uniref:Uncharacterized protein n=1 Tax=Clohesyomyces aquaticus TaxID=1231657 RepID=A0A1Y2A9G6_9PLEO|nr:hypothetical protein BCR34DRAFT_595601 [Clohesyomyces aquaticus]
MHLSRVFTGFVGFASGTSAFSIPSSDNFNLVSRDASGVDTCTLATSATANASIQLSSWIECQINGFFPYPENGAWDTVFASAFSKDLKATFNDTQYGYDGWLQLYKSFNVTLGRSFSKFQHGFTSSLAVPNSSGDKGGMVYVIGWEGGRTVLGKDVWFSDAAFAVVKDVGGARKVVEFRESSNIPNSAPLPPENPWTCAFDHRHYGP